MSECNCRVHQKIRAWRQALHIDTPEKEAAFNDMLEEWELASMDADRAKAIFDGSWPQAEEILERALSKVRTAQISS